MVGAVVADPGLAQDLTAEAPLVVVALVVEGVFVERAVLRVAEAMGRGAQADDRAAAVQVVDDRLHLLDRDGLEAREDHEQVRVLQRLGAGDVAGVAQRDVAVLRVDPEQHRAGEALVLGEDARELRQGLLGLVLMVVGDEHDLLAFAGAFGADVRQRGIGRAGDEAEQGEGEDGEGAHGGKGGRGGLRSTEYRVQSAEYRVQSTEYRVQSTECRVQSTECSRDG